MQQIDEKLIAIHESNSEFPVRSAVAYFLFMVMPADGHTHPSEVARLERIIADEFELDRKETETLIAHAEAQKLSGHGMEQVAELLLSELDRPQLLDLISHMWEMVFADERLHEVELLLVERVATLLNIEQRHVTAAMTA